MKLLVVIAAMSLQLSTADISVSVSRKEPTKDPAKCKLCSAAIAEIQIAWTDQDTVDLVKIGMEYVCTHVPISDCGNWMDVQLTRLDSIIQHLTPQQICPGVCAAVISHEKESFKCEICRFIGDMVVEILSGDATEKDISAVIGKMCGVIPFEMVSSECEALVKEYGPYYLTQLASKINVTELCRGTAVCDSNDSSTLEPLFLSLGAKLGDKCSTCIEVLSTLKEILGSPETLDLIHLGVHSLCHLSHIPGCDIIVDGIVDQTIKHLVPRISPEYLCRKTDFCRDEVLNSTRNRVIGSGDEVGSLSGICSECVHVASQVVALLKKEGVDELLKETIDKACYILPVRNCRVVLRDLLKTLAEADPNTLCTNLGLCTKHVGLQEQNVVF